MIGDYPEAGLAVLSLPGLRRYVTAPYQIDYVQDGDTIFIVAIRHGRQGPRDVDLDDDFNDV